MAQLRDSKTSEILYEGTPLECVLLADKLGRDEVIFDDVGLNFDPDAVRAAHDENVDGLAKVAKSRAKSISDDDKAVAQANLDARKAEEQAAQEQAAAVEQRLQEARARLGD